MPCLSSEEKDENPLILVGFKSKAYLIILLTTWDDCDKSAGHGGPTSATIKHRMRRRIVGLRQTPKDESEVWSVKCEVWSVKD